MLLIVEDDITFARILVDLAHDRGIKALVALRGSSAMTLAREFKPGAITLDINLPDMAGWTILDRLKHDPATRHIPVHIISGDENRRRGLALGAMTYLEKSVTKDIAERSLRHHRAFAAAARQEAAGRVRRRRCRRDRMARAARRRRTSRSSPWRSGGEALAVAEAAVSGRHRDRPSICTTFAPIAAGGRDPEPTPARRRRPILLWRATGR